MKNKKFISASDMFKKILAKVTMFKLDFMVMLKKSKTSLGLIKTVVDALDYIDKTIILIKKSWDIVKKIWDIVSKL